MNYRILGKTDLRVSTLSFGGSPLGNEYGAADSEECTRAVHCALDLGINFFDVSPYYGRTLAEERLGAALAGRRAEAIVATKCGRYDKAEFDFSAKRVFASIEESLGRLRTDYVDLLQAHDIEFGDLRQVMEETVPALREVQRQGKARYIGITGYQLKAMKRVAERERVDTVLSYCRYNLLISDLDDLLTPFARSEGIGLINAAPLHMGVLSESGPPPWHPAPDAVKRAGADIVALCRSRGADVADIALQYCLAHPYAATTLAGMDTVAQVERNAAAAAGAADRELLAAIQRRVSEVANMTWPMGRPENEDYAEDAENRRAPSPVAL